MSDQTALEILKKTLKSLGPDLIEEILAAGMHLPAKWKDWPPERAFEYLRCRLEFTQAELAQKAGLTQAQVSLIEGGGDAKMSTWRRLFRAMGFELMLLPVTELPFKELRERAEQGRPRGHWLRLRARPRRRRLAEAKARAASAGSRGA